MAYSKLKTQGALEWHGIFHEFEILPQHQLGLMQRIEGLYNPPVDREEPDVIADALNKLADMVRNLDPDQALPETASIIKEMGLDPNKRSTQSQFNMFLRENELLQRVPATREQYKKLAAAPATAGLTNGS